MPAGGPKELRTWFLTKAQAAGIKFCGGVDAGLSDDLFAFVLVSDKFATGVTDTGARVTKTIMVPWFWIPEKNIRAHELNWRVPLQLWIREGWIKVAGEELVDLDVVEKDIKAICATYKVPVIGYDKWKLQTMCARMHEQFVSHCVAVPQLPSFLTTPCRDFKAGILNGTYAHLANPVFKWMCSNVDLEPSPNTGGIKPAKSGGSSRNKIDGVQAAVTAIQQLHDPDNKKFFGAVGRILSV
jgi:phage terminase large subunit-like protein